jgi:hypothetical protein
MKTLCYWLFGEDYLSLWIDATEEDPDCYDIVESCIKVY